MNLPEISIHRHVLAYMMSGVILLFGVISYFSIGVDRYPHIEIPIISITTVQRGANPEILDASVTNIIERKVNSIPGIDFVQSSSTPGVSVVTMSFHLYKDIDVAFNEVQAKVNQVRNLLPDDADPPVVAKVEITAAPIFWLHLQGNRTLQQLTLYAQNVLRRQLETIDGVGDILIGGARDRTIRVEIMPERLVALGLTVQDLLSAFKAEHLLMPGGFLTSKHSEKLIKLDLEYHNPRQLAKMVVGFKDGAPLHLEEVANILDAEDDLRGIARRDGEEMIGLGVIKVAGSNTVAIVDEINRRLETDIRPQLPPGITLKIGTDQSFFIRETIAALQEHIIGGTILAGLVVLIFLRNVRATLIIAAAIPVSIAGAVAVTYFFGYTFNGMTMLAMLLLVGVVVDDSIVVLENIYRHREKLDPDPMSAAVNGTKEVVFAVLAATLSLVSIFLPVVFMGGMTGRFFSSFAVVMVAGVLVSWFVAMTLTPMMCSRYLQVERDHGRLYRFLETSFQKMENSYRRLLLGGLKHPAIAVLVTVLIIASSTFFFKNIGKEFMPKEDESRIMIFAKAPMGSSMEYTLDRLGKIDQVLKGQEGVAFTFAAIGLFPQALISDVIAFVTLVPREYRDITQWEVVDELRLKLANIPGVRAFASEPPKVGGGRGEALQFSVKGKNLDEVAKYARQLHQRLMTMPEMGRIDLDLKLDMPQMVLNVDRERAHSLGLNAREVSMAANILAGGMDIAKYNDYPGDGERYDVRMKAVDGEFRTPDDLRKIFLRTPQGSQGELVRLDTVASFEERIGPAQIDRFDLQYAAKFYTDPTIPLSEAIEKLDLVAKEMLPLGYSIALNGQAREFGSTITSVGFVFAIALVLLYMVLASQFDSFHQPFVIMLAQPLAMIGGLIALWMFGQTLNIYSMLGMVLLIGLVAKNSILLVDLTNQRREQGLSIYDALLDACPIRMRPVLMTSLTIILTLLPAAIGLGPGADRNKPMALAIVGGMITSTLLTLVVVPVVYYLMESGIDKVRAWREQRRVLSSGARS